MTEIKVSQRYATALLDSALKENIVDKVVEDMIELKNTLLISKELRNMFHSPVIQNWKKKDIVSELFQKHLSKLTFSFIILLIQKKRENIISSIIDQFEKLYNKEFNRLPISITTAIEINDDLKNSITQKLHANLNKVILPTFLVSPEIKGGLIIQVDDWVYDSSIKNQLEHLRTQLAETIS